jgi:hypothetical protein
VVVFTGFGFPGPDPILRPPDFNDTRQFVMEGDAPVPAIAAHVHETAAAIEPGLHGVPHRRRVILGMRPGQDHLVVLDQRIAIAVQILVRDDVVIEAMI